MRHKRPEDTWATKRHRDSRASIKTASSSDSISVSKDEDDVSPGIFSVIGSMARSKSGNQELDSDLIETDSSQNWSLVRVSIFCFDT